MTTHTIENDLKQLSTDELVALFRTLAAPEIAEMNGEYAATLLRQPNLIASAAGIGLTNPLMPWLGKALRPVDAQSGRGYNYFSFRGKVLQRYPMHTRIAPSRFDGGPAFHLIYRAFESLCGEINMVDELRRLAPGRYLGMGTFGFTDAQRRIPLPFLLEGPTHEYRGDIGKERQGFVPGEREIPALAERSRTNQSA